MKTKIVYISGGDFFAPSDIRGAFDEVREMLGLSADTVIFGVPVDSDDAMAGAGIGADVQPSVAAPSAPVDVAQPVPATEEIPEPKPVKARRAKKAAEVAEAAQIADYVPVAEAAESEIAEPAAEPESAAAAPILSVIGLVRPESEPVAEELEDTVNITAEFVNITAETNDDITVIDAASVRISGDVEIDLNSAPAPERPKTIEDILTQMAPLTEEKPVDLSKYDDDNMLDDDDAGASVDIDLESDATLSKLAEEFVSAEDGALSAKPAKSGKIGKLKNILPFKKAKKEDGGVLGDLFGWAGIAANDDDEKFSMPDFFRANS